MARRRAIRRAPRTVAPPKSCRVGRWETWSLAWGDPADPVAFPRLLDAYLVRSVIVTGGPATYSGQLVMTLRDGAGGVVAEHWSPVSGGGLPTRWQLADSVPASSYASPTRQICTGPLPPSMHVSPQCAWDIVLDPDPTSSELELTGVVVTLEYL